MYVFNPERAMRRILVVDDDPLVRKLMTETLLDWPGTAVQSAEDGALAAECIEIETFDLALIDAMLPKLSGFELAGLAANRNTSVLMVSGHPEANARLRYFGFPVLEKPFAMAELLSVSQAILADTAENIARVQQSAARMRANVNALSAAVGQSRLLLLESAAARLAAPPRRSRRLGKI